MSTQTSLFTPLTVETAPERSRPLLEKMAFLHVPSEVFAAVRSHLPLTNPKLNSLVVLTREIVSKRGPVGAQTIENFLAAGYRRDQLLDVLIGVALKTMSKYVDHISPTELDRAFQVEA